MGAYVDKYLGPVGGFSTRQNTIEFVTVLPNSDMVEVEGILEKLTKIFKCRGSFIFRLAPTRASL